LILKYVFRKIGTIGFSTGGTIVRMHGAQLRAQTVEALLLFIQFDVEFAL